MKPCTLEKVTWVMTVKKINNNDTMFVKGADDDDLYPFEK